VSFPPGDWRRRFFRGDRPAAVAERVERLRPALLAELTAHRWEKNYYG
jgi:hypothetical protein